MKIEKRFYKFKKENKIEAIQIITTIGRDDKTICLAQTDIKHGKHEVFEATKQGYKLLVYNDNDSWEIFDKGNCIGEQGIIKQWEIMKVLNG